MGVNVPLLGVFAETMTVSGGEPDGGLTLISEPALTMRSSGAFGVTRSRETRAASSQPTVAFSAWVA